MLDIVIYFALLGLITGCVIVEILNDINRNK